MYTSCSSECDFFCPVSGTACYRVRSVCGPLVWHSWAKVAHHLVLLRLHLQQWRLHHQHSLVGRAEGGVFAVRSKKIGAGGRRLWVTDLFVCLSVHSVPARLYRRLYLLLSRLLRLYFWRFISGGSHSTSRLSRWSLSHRVLLWDGAQRNHQAQGRVHHQLRAGHCGRALGHAVHDLCREGQQVCLRHHASRVRTNVHAMHGSMICLVMSVVPFRATLTAPY